MLSINVIVTKHSNPTNSNNPGQGVQLTMGRQGDESKWPYGGAIDAAKSFGAVMVDKDVGEVCVDQKNKIVSSPAFMYNGEFHEIQDGVGNMVKELLKMIK